ncbi:MAG: aminotransferase class III-fold pyridoxal phosphate-dependent enzyme [Rhodospirillaceae bacterium]|jgi:glutamate-1-semialdehyde 2,1-aminomutase|nr:aminotransferase class III-fold pyridoxal phosphate-dependent enzyme [Rhodospirillaceae bacterium]MBT5811541.1 aminotransferase class III-fold pyridoxal phosphate-dependent enzyme [Rhodospirillaceae bacterium]
MSADTQEDELLRDMARRVLPGGSFGNAAADIIIREGKGGRVWDIDGKEYVDFLLGSGPMLVGHGHPDVMAAVQAQIPLGTTFFANNEHGIRLAADVVDAVACADKVRFVSSGSEATFYAMRVARAHAKRDKILKFEGGFHGMSDYALMSMSPARPGNFPQAIPDTPGIPQRVRDEVLIAPFNDADTAASLIREHRDELAGVIVEPFQRLVPPKPGFLEALREVTTECGIALIFDEVVTGFRFAYGGAQEYYGVVPDLCAMGKVVGGGFPLALVAGREDYMAHFDKGAVPDDEFMTQIGTLSGNPVAATAGLATLEVLRRPGAYERIFETGRTLMNGLRDMLAKADVPAQVIGEPPLFDVFFVDNAIGDYRGTLGADAARAERFNASLRDSGILKGPSKFYVSLAHDDADIAQTLAAFKTAVEVL